MDISDLTAQVTGTWNKALQNYCGSSISRLNNRVSLNYLLELSIEWREIEFDFKFTMIQDVMSIIQDQASRWFKVPSLSLKVRQIDNFGCWADNLTSEESIISRVKSII